VITADDFDAELAEAQSQRRIRTAYHEAGHAVAAHRLGYRLLCASIREKPTDPDELPGIKRGYVCYDAIPTHQKKPREIAIDRARIAMAGVIAGGIRAGSRYKAWDWDEFGGRATAGDDDLEEMKRFLEDAGIPLEEQRQPYLNLRIRTRRLLATLRNWAAVNAVAEALLRHETLGGETFIAVITSARGSD